MKREVESGWCRTASAWLWGPQGHLCAFKMASESRFLSPTAWLVFVSHTYTHTHSDIYTPINTSLGMLPNCQIGIVSFHFHSQSQIALFFPSFFFLLLDIFKSSNSHTAQSFGLSFCPPPPHPLSSTSAFLSPSSITRWEFRWIYRPADSKRSYRAAVIEQSMQGWPGQFIQSMAKQDYCTALAWSITDNYIHGLTCLCRNLCAAPLQQASVAVFAIMARSMLNGSMWDKLEPLVNLLQSQCWCTLYLCVSLTHILQR